MTSVIVAGVGQTRVGEHWDTSLRDLALEAASQALADAGALIPQALFVGNMLAPNLSNQAHLGALLADHLFLRGIEAVAVEAAGASGGAALRQGYLAVASGFVDVVLVIGAEKFTDQVGANVEAALATTADSDHEAVQGLTSNAQAALLAQRYLHEYDVPEGGLAGFAVTAHENSRHNPMAMFRNAIDQETYARSPVVNEPLKQYDVAPNADGAASVILASAGLLDRDSRRPRVELAGSASAVDAIALHDRANLLEFRACQISAQQALAQHGMALDSIDLFEYHDAYSIHAALALEATGFAKPGEGWKLAADGGIGRGGRIPCATMGGLKARGFPGGATGVYQAVEATLQLQRRAGDAQVPTPRHALIQSVGGPASTVVSHVLRVID